MKKYLSEYLAQLEALLAAEQPDDFDYAELQRKHLTMVQFMQHERLIHFLVTMLFAVCFFISLCSSKSLRYFSNASAIVAILFSSKRKLKYADWKYT